MARVTMNSTEFGQFRKGQSSAWFRVQQHLIRGDEVVVTHYRRPVALIVPYPRDASETAE